MFFKVVVSIIASILTLWALDDIAERIEPGMSREPIAIAVKAVISMTIVLFIML